MDSNCSCPELPPVENFTEHPLVTELRNASIFYQIHRRATHSKEAFEAFICIGGLTSLVIISVICSKMWRDRDSFAVQQRSRVEYTQHGPKDEILVRGMYRNCKFFIVK